jgi:hypothetical protein
VTRVAWPRTAADWQFVAKDCSALRLPPTDGPTVCDLIQWALGSGSGCSAVAAADIEGLIRTVGQKSVVLNTVIHIYML